jgi:hypothetical protein
MNHFKPGRGKKGPEKIIQERIESMLRYKGWFVLRTHGNMFQSGLPDNFACHTSYGQRWIEIKDPNRHGDVFTSAQHDTFPKMCANGSGVWVLTGDTEEEYNKLFARHNWYQYLSNWMSTKGLGS